MSYANIYLCRNGLHPLDSFHESSYLYKSIKYALGGSGYGNLSRSNLSVMMDFLKAEKENLQLSLHNTNERIKQVCLFSDSIQEKFVALDKLDNDKRDLKICLESLEFSLQYLNFLQRIIASAEDYFEELDPSSYIKVELV